MNFNNILRRCMLFLLLATSNAFSFAQVIDNGGFEQADSIPFKNPGGLDMGVPTRLSSNAISLSKSSFPTIHAISKPFSIYDSGSRISNSINEQDTIIGFLTNASQLPVASTGGCGCFNLTSGYFKISIYYRYHTPAFDSAYLRVIYKFHYLVLRDLEFAIPKTTGGNFVVRELWGEIFNRDSVPTDFIYYFRTSHPKYPGNISDSSVLEIKHISTDGSSQSCDRYFNLWKKLIYFNPIGWTSHKGYHAGHRDAYLGRGALALSRLQLENGNYEGFVERNFKVNANGVAYGGAAYTQTLDTLLGYYKFKGNTNQSAKIRLMLLKNQQVIYDSSLQLLPSGSEYQNFKLPFQVSASPDTLRIEISSPDTLRTGDTLLLDEIQLASAPLRTGLLKNLEEKQHFTFYPNPVSDWLYADKQLNWNQVSSIGICDLLGNTLQTITPDHMPVSFTEYQNGIYLLVVHTKDGNQYIQKIIKQ